MVIWNPKDQLGGAVVMEADGAALNRGDPVKLSTNGVVVAGDGDPVFGVCSVDIANGAKGVIWTQGTFEVTNTAGGALLMGTRVAAAASGEVDAGTTTNPVVGVIVDADIAASAKGRILLYSDSKHVI